MKSFRNFLKVLDSITSINAGGCGVSALMMYRWLKKFGLLENDTRFVFLYSPYSGEYKKTNDAYFDGNSRRVLPCAHVVLYHGGKYYDSRGIIDKEAIEDSKKNFGFHEFSDEKTMLKAINQVDHWNPAFNRTLGLKTLKEHINLRVFDIKTYNKVYVYGG
jgi:hypothetical protein